MDAIDMAHETFDSEQQCLSRLNALIERRTDEVIVEEYELIEAIDATHPVLRAAVVAALARRTGVLALALTELAECESIDVPVESELNGQWLVRPQATF